MASTYINERRWATVGPSIVCMLWTRIPNKPMTVCFRSFTLVRVLYWLECRKHKKNFQQANGRRWIEREDQPATFRPLTPRARARVNTDPATARVSG